MVYSAGLVIICNARILLINPIGKNALGSYSIPKGMVEKGESILDAAMREVFEETGIAVEIKDINKERFEIKYYNLKTKKPFKKVYYYFCHIQNDKLPKVLPKHQLQECEVKYAAFFVKEEAKKIIHWRQKQILYQLRENEF